MISVIANALVAADAADLSPVRADLAAALAAHDSIEVRGKVVTLCDGKPLSETMFVGRFKRPHRWLITWHDAGPGPFKPSGEAWGGDAVGSLRFTGASGIKTASAEMTIAAAAGISHSLTAWLHAMYRGDFDHVIPDKGDVVRDGDRLTISASSMPGSDRVIATSAGVITSIVQVSDTAKLKRPMVVMSDEEIRSAVEQSGETATPAKLAETRKVLQDAQERMAASTSVFHVTYTFAWAFDQRFTDHDLVPDMTRQGDPKPAR